MGNILGKGLTKKSYNLTCQSKARAQKAIRVVRDLAFD